MKSFLVLVSAVFLTYLCGCVKLEVSSNKGDKVSGWGLITNIKVRLETSGSTNDVEVALDNLED